MMAAPRDPRIKVDLNILQDANMDRLEEFARQFSDPATRLADALESFSSRVSSLGGGGGPGVGANASVAPGWQGGGGGGGGGIAGGGPGGGINPNPNAPTPPGSIGTATTWQKGALAGPFLNQFERGQIRLGSFPGGSNASQALFAASWISGLGAYKKVGEAGDPQPTPDAFHGEDGGWYAPRSTIAQHASSSFGYLGQASMRLPQWYNTLTNIAQFGYGSATSGSQAGGYAPIGGMGLPFLSPAWQHAMGMRWHALKQSDFGFNPNYSYGDATEAQNVIAASGYWGEDASWLASTMRNLKQNNHFLNPEDTMAMLDPIIRFGGEDRNRATDMLQALADSAKSAHIGLQQFTSSLVQGSTSLAQTTGMTTGYAGSALQALSAGTRIDPTVLSQNLGTPSNMIMGAALTGQHISDVMMGSGGQVKAMMKFPELMFRSMLGMDPRNFQQFKKTHPQEAKAILDRISYAYLEDPKIFGGMNPRQMLGLMSRNVDPAERMQAYQDVINRHDTTTAGFFGAIRHFGGQDAKILREEAIKRGYGHITDKNANKADQWLRGRMADMLNKNNDKSAHRVTVMLDPWARKLLHLRGEASSSSSNTGDSTWHTATRIGKDLLELDVNPAADFRALKSLIP